ncbi:MAG: fibronectin type III domain-containing protein, partial [Oscillospiraceae bacterium]|nr:fibronectin type III domain-containing protein [Oscillospiraceae bacterium]
MYKLINHDCIKLKWDEVTGADGYYIYRTDTGTGKTVKYKSIVKGTDVTIKNLSPETEYIFYVEPMTGKNGKTTVGQRSVGTKLTTPKEWYYYDDSVVDEERRAMKSRFYRTDYSKGKKEKINLGDIKYVDEIIYYNGWYYVIGNLDAIKSGPYPYGAVNNRMCIARIREDGTQKEILFDDFFHADDILYAYIITDDAIYLQQQCYNTLEENDKELYYFDAELCWLKKISLKTGEIETIALPCPYSWFDVHDGYIYYGYNDIYKYSKNNKKYLIYGDQGVYISAWYDRQTVKLIDAEKYYSY